MFRCKPLLGTFVEISIESIESIQEPQWNDAISLAFQKIEKVQELMSFHSEHSDLSKINREAHLNLIKVDGLTEKLLKLSLEIHQKSEGIFDCGVGHLLIQLGLRPNHHNLEQETQGSIKDLKFYGNGLIGARRQVCLDLGGIAKGFAVDLAVETLQANGVKSATVNAGGDLRIFGQAMRPIQLRDPINPHLLTEVGKLSDGAFATSGNYFLEKSDAVNTSHLINPINQQAINTDLSFSVIADQCVIADALTKVLAISQDPQNPCFEYYCAIPIQHHPYA
jgi:thiamine biosynthesis lipoprotein